MTDKATDEGFSMFDETNPSGSQGDAQPKAEGAPPETSTGSPPAAPAEAESESPQPPGVDKPFGRLPPGLGGGAKASAEPKGGAKPKGGAAGGKAKEPTHAECKRFGTMTGELFDAGFNIMAAIAESPIRANISDPEDPRNGLVWTIEFPPPEKPNGSAIQTEIEGAKAAFAKLFTTETPGKAIGYHMARCVPTLSGFDRWLREHPWVTMLLVTGAITGQFAYRVYMTQGTAKPTVPGVKVEKPDGSR